MWYDVILCVYLNFFRYTDLSILWYLTLLSPPILSQLLLSFLTLSYHAHLRVDLGRFGVRFEVHFGVHFDPPGDLPEGPKNGLKKHPKPGGPKHCKTAAGTPKSTSKDGKRLLLEIKLMLMYSKCEYRKGNLKRWNMRDLLHSSR